MGINERSYPRSETEVLDGQLRINSSTPEDVVLIISRATKGPSEQLYNVDNSVTASAVFGATSPLTKKMQLAYNAGAKSVALYRVGGQPSSVENLFGLGSVLETSEASVVADHSLKVYVGPEPLVPSRECVIVTKNDKVVYSNTAASPIDLGTVILTGFDKTENLTYAGSVSDPVPFSELVKESGKRVVETFSNTKEIELKGYVEEKVSKYGFTVTFDGKRTTKYTKSGTTIELDDSLIEGKTEYSVEVSYINKYTEEELKELEVETKQGRDLLNETYKDYYVALDKALEGLPAPASKAIVLDELHNVPNIVNGDTDKDRLEYLSIEVDEEGTRTYEWSTNKFLYQKGTGSTTDVEEADVSSNGEPIVLKQYHEVSFTHLAGMWAYKKTVEEGFYPNLVIGTIGPKAYTTKLIARWVGQPPIYNSNGKIITNGKGLLGDRWLVGSTDYAGGLFATDTGFPDGTVRVDSAQYPIDLGKYISIVISQVVMQGSDSTVYSGSATYGGVIGALTVGDGTTNNSVGGVYDVIPLQAQQEKQLNNAGYVFFKTRTNGLTVFNGILATRNSSDFQFVGTSVVLNQITTEMNKISDSYIGKGIDGVLFTGLHTAVDSKFKELQTRSYFKAYTMNIRQVGANTIRVNYQIDAKDELQIISNKISLTRSLIDQ